MGGAAFSVGVSLGGGGGLVGWFPLGPREAYYPSYNVSPTYIRQVNVTNTRITNINVTNINVTNNTYVNRSAVVAVPQNSFVSAQPVRNAAVAVNAAQIQQAPVIGAAPRVAPLPQSVVPNFNDRRAAVPPAALTNRPVVAKLAPPPPAVPFEAERQLLQQHRGTPVASDQLQNLRAQAARQSPVPARMQVQAIDTRQVLPLTPTVKSSSAATFAQRPAQPRNAPQQMPVQSPRAQPVPSAATPAMRSQIPVQPRPMVREQNQPPAQREPPRAAPSRPAREEDKKREDKK